MERPLLSIGMIVKNEIRSIERCLKALQPLREAFPCELVIADTGSTDGTREVVAKYADILFDFPWIDDFAAARNAVMKCCSGDWYFSVDADEYLDPDLTGFRELFHTPPKEQPDIGGITVRNYTGRDLVHAPYSSFTALRIARLGVGICYHGAIHESFFRPDKPAHYLLYNGIILHHDGYAFQSEEERRKKAERNLDLLDKALKKAPDDPRLLVECIESAAVFPFRVVQYVQRGMELLDSPGRTPNMGFDGYLSARCAEVALGLDLPQAQEWLDRCFKSYPDAIAVRLDAAYAAIKWYWSKKEYHNTISMSQVYLKALADEQNGKITTSDRLNIVFQHNTETNYYQAQSVLACSLAREKKENEALSHLSKWALEKVPASTAKDWLRAMALLEDMQGAAEEMARALPLLEPDGDDQWRKERWQAVLPLLKQFFKPGWGASEGVEHPWQLLLGCDGPLGQGAKVMACTCAAEAEELLAQVEDWETFPPEALLHALTLGAGLPTNLCAQRPNVRLGLISAMAQGDPDFAFHMAVYPWQIPDTLALLQTQFDLVTYAVQRIAPLKEADEAGLCRELCGRLADLSRELLPRLYRSELLANQADWIVLPGNHQFCLWLLEGEKKRAAGDIPGYLRDLHQGLKQAPGMKDLADFLLDEAEKETARAAASPELLALAEQVKAILSRFPPDDPAVAELKASPAYQRVAPLIEGIEAPVFGGLPQ